MITAVKINGSWPCVVEPILSFSVFYFICGDIDANYDALSNWFIAYCVFINRRFYFTNCATQDRFLLLVNGVKHQIALAFRKRVAPLECWFFFFFFVKKMSFVCNAARRRVSSTCLCPPAVPPTLEKLFDPAYDNLVLINWRF